MRVCESYSDLCLGDNLELLMSCVASICIVFFKKPLHFCIKFQMKYQ